MRNIKALMINLCEIIDRSPLTTLRQHDTIFWCYSEIANFEHDNALAVIHQLRNAICNMNFECKGIETSEICQRMLAQQN
jgi:hypothetical protein